MSESNESSVDQRFGQRVRHARELMTFGQEHVAVLLRSLHGVQWHQTTVAKVEAGTRPAKLAEAVALADVLATSVAELLGEQPHGDPREFVDRYQHLIRREEVDRMARYVEARQRQLDEVKTFDRFLEEVDAGRIPGIGPNSTAPEQLEREDEDKS